MPNDGFPSSVYFFIQTLLRDEGHYGKESLWRHIKELFTCSIQIYVDVNFMELGPFYHNPTLACVTTVMTSCILSLSVILASTCLYVTNMI